MALTIIAVVLVIVFFPILVGVAATAALLIFAFGSLAIGIGMIVYGIYCAGKAATQPILAQKAAIVAIVAYLLLPWLQRRSGGDFIMFIGIMIPIVFVYGMAMLMIYKRHGLPAGGDKGSVLLLVLGGILDACGTLSMYWFGGSSPVYVILRVVSSALITAGTVLLLLQPSHEDVADEETLGIQIMSCAGAINYAGRLIRLVHIPFPLPFIILRLAIAAGLIVFVLPIAKNFTAGKKNP